MLGFKNPVILKDEFGIYFILNPHDRNPIRWQIQAGTNRAEFLEIQKRVQKGDVVFDVGANIGLVSVMLSKIVGENGIVHSFEPHPDTFQELLKTLALNSCTNVRVNAVALSSINGAADLHYVNNNKLSSLGSIADKTYGENKSMKVPTITIDSYCDSHNVSRIDFLKIDVEGFEYQVLSGATRMLSNKTVGCIQFEMHEKNEMLLDFLQTKDYQIEENASGFNWYASPRRKSTQSV